MPFQDRIWSCKCHFHIILFGENFFPSQTCWQLPQGYYSKSHLAKVYILMSRISGWYAVLSIYSFLVSDGLWNNRKFVFFNFPYILCMQQDSCIKISQWIKGRTRGTQRSQFYRNEKTAGKSGIEFVLAVA